MEGLFWAGSGGCGVGVVKRVRVYIKCGVGKDVVVSRSTVNLTLSRDPLSLLLLRLSRMVEMIYLISQELRCK